MDQRKADKDEEKLNSQAKGIAREDRFVQGRGR